MKANDYSSSSESSESSEESESGEGQEEESPTDRYGRKGGYKIKRTNNFCVGTWFSFDLIVG